MAAQMITAIMFSLGHTTTGFTVVGFVVVVGVLASSAWKL
jgi:hypothetical protein